MSFKTFAAFCRKLPHVTEDVKWESNLVFSIGSKMFAVFELPDISHVSFRTTPWLFSTLIGKDGIEPAPYLARYNWVLVTKPKALPVAMLRQLLRESYELVAAGLPAKTRKELGLQEAFVSKKKPVPKRARTKC
ncbi:MmcQ/YjbR family DNA-binding protein [bacterium]|nr:MmcQ/YjbR family DNA-binding protein [bacterium]